MSDKLPNGWARVPLEQIAQINPRHDKCLSDELEATFVSMTGISETHWRFEKTERRKLGEIRKGYTHFAEGDVLFAKITPCMENGKAAIATDLANAIGCGTTELHVLRPEKGIESKYLFHFIHQPFFRQEAARNFTGTAGQLRVSISFVREAEIPLPPTCEQKRIVVSLEKVLSKVEASQKRLEKIPLILKSFRQSVLAAACSGRLTADWRNKNPNAEPFLLSHGEEVSSTEKEDDFPDTWRMTEIGNLTVLVTSGSRGWAKYYSDSGSIFVRAQNINADFLNLENVAFVAPPESAEGLRTKVQQSDILITITGANVTKSALVEKPIENAYISQHVALVRLSDVRLSKFLFYVVISPAHGRKQLLEAAYGQGKPGLNLTNVREVVVRIPPLAEQKEIVRRVEELFKLADGIEARYQKAKAHVDKLTQSILAKAFRGELVQQDPNDEPAEKLLERLKKTGFRG